VENSEDSKKIKLAMEIPEEFRKIKQLKRPGRTGSGELVKNLPRFEKQWPRQHRISLFLRFLHKQEVSWALTHTT
jgi:hypothetical protein